MGKDNIVFHSVIWPAMLLGYGEGGEVGAGKPLVLPWNVVASEFLTMEGRQFSTSRGAPVLLRDFLSRYDPDPLRYFLTAAGPETQDTEFTWAEFVRRNNDELLANWGNLVNRTLTNVHRNFGEVPQPGELTEADRAVLARVEEGFDTVAGLIEQARFKAALAEAMRLSSEANQYLSDEAPWAVLKTDRERAGTILYVALRAVDSLKVLLTPFLPFSAQQLHELLGYEGWIAGPLAYREIADEDGGHSILTGDYERWTGRWAPSELPPGQPLREPSPLFRKLDLEDVVRQELG
jgi:methionyl-tRNA synthetase